MFFNDLSFFLFRFKFKNFNPSLIAYATLIEPSLCYGPILNNEFIVLIGQWFSKKEGEVERGGVVIRDEY